MVVALQPLPQLVRTVCLPVLCCVVVEAGVCTTTLAHSQGCCAHFTSSRRLECVREAGGLRVLTNSHHCGTACVRVSERACVHVYYYLVSRTARMYVLLLLLLRHVLHGPVVARRPRAESGRPAECSDGRRRQEGL